MAKVDFNKIISNSRIVSSEEALKDVVPIIWPKEILSGGKKAVVTNLERNKNDKCAKLEISFL